MNPMTEYITSRPCARRLRHVGAGLRLHRLQHKRPNATLSSPFQGELRTMKGLSVEYSYRSAGL